jgi:nitroreductase
MKFDLDIIRTRSSVRSYDGTPLPDSDKSALAEAFAAAVPGPFGGRARFALVSAEMKGKVKMGTYGLISNAPAYIVGSIARAPRANEDFGYAMEGVILEATRLGLGTCWIGGVFDRSRATAALGAGSGDLIPSICAIGRPSEVRSLADRLIASVASSRTRKDPSLLFFDGSFGQARTMDPSETWTKALLAVRAAPSASNKQPWRILRTPPIASSHEAFHLYLAADKAYNGLFGEVKLQNVDMGIAMRHFEAACQALGLPGSWTELTGSGRLPRDDSGYSYIATWLC